jgi:LysM repeat protein
MRILLIFTMIFAPSLIQWGCAPHQGIYHTVEPGQTLYRISRTYGVDEKHLARLNGIEDPNHLRVGQRVFVPGVSKERTVPAT